MSHPSLKMAAWLSEWMRTSGIPLWGAADLAPVPTPMDDNGQGFPRALAFALPMPPDIMASIQGGPNQAYADAYARTNETINHLSSALAAQITDRGFRANALAASMRTDTENIKGDFPHKTAATRAGLGWIGRHCQLVTRPYGSWVRLGTVFTDMDIPCAPPKERSHCGTCRRCVEACPAAALKGEAWYPGIPRKEILDVRRCDQWKKDHYFEYYKGHTCGICSAVCPFGTKTLNQRPSQEKMS